MGMLDQLDLDAVKRLYRADLPVPVDVLNLIHFKDEEAYKWYGALTFPLLKAVGAEVGWMGAHVESAGGQLVYQRKESSPIVISKRAHPGNTNPLVFNRTCLFRLEDQDSCKAAMQPGVLNQLREIGADASVQLYERVPRRKALPAAVAKLFG